jgi:hypothetical protein
VRERRGIVSDDVLLHKVEEFRNSSGISDFDFKLFNGWLQISKHGRASLAPKRILHKISCNFAKFLFCGITY